MVTDLLGPHVAENVGHGGQHGASLIEPAIPPPALRLLNANKRKETLLRTYYLRHSFDNFDPMLVNFIIERLGASISGLRSNTSLSSSNRVSCQEILRSTLILCATGLRSQAKSYHVCTLAYLSLQSQMRSEDIQLLLTYVKPPTAVDMPPLDHDAVTSWPLPIISISEDPKKSALNKMFKDYKDLKAGAEGEKPRSQACPLDVICN